MDTKFHSTAQVEGVELSVIKANAVSLPANQRRVDLRVNVTARFNASGCVCVGGVWMWARRHIHECG